MDRVERMEALRRRKAQLEARLAALEARAKANSRKADARRKIIIGAGVLALVERHPGFGFWLARELPAVLAERDRALVADLGQPRPSP